MLMTVPIVLVYSLGWALTTVEESQLTIPYQGSIYVISNKVTTLNSDIVITKEWLGGGRHWKQVYNEGKDEYAYGATADKGGNLYLAGAIVNNNDWDFLVLKYSSTGAFLWSRNYDSGYADVASLIRVDKEGFVYVVGNSHNGRNLDIRISQYDSRGGQLMWTRTYDSGHNDYPRSLTLTSGNVVVVMDLADPTTDEIFYTLTITYDSSGRIK